jgi:hypothetical protein
LEIEAEIRIYGERDQLLKQERVLHICKETKATEYITSSKGKSYLTEDVFIESHINIELVSYQKSIDFLKKSKDANDCNYSIIDTIAHFGLDEVKGFLHHER